MRRSLYLTAALFFGILVTSAAGAAQPRYYGRDTKNVPSGNVYDRFGRPSGSIRPGLNGQAGYYDRFGRQIGSSRPSITGRNYYDRYNRYQGRTQSSEVFWPGLLQ